MEVEHNFAINYELKHIFAFFWKIILKEAYLWFVFEPGGAMWLWSWVLKIHMISAVAILVEMFPFGPLTLLFVH